MYEPGLQPKWLGQFGSPPPCWITPVEIVDAELIEDREYASMGKSSADRVKILLGKRDSIRRSKERGSEVSTQPKVLFHKFMEQLENIFKNLPKPMEWRSFYSNGLPLLIDFCKEVREVSIQHQLSQQNAQLDVHYYRLFVI